MAVLRALAAASLVALLGLLAPSSARAQLSIPPAGPVEVQATQGAATDDLKLVVDTEPPTIEVRSPVESSVVAGNAVTVTGTVSDLLSPFFPDLGGSPLFGRVLYRVRDASGVTLDSGSVPLSEGRFTAPDVLLGEGEHTIELQAVDASGQFAFEETRITSDPDAPAVTLLSPLDGEALLFEETGVTLNFAEPTTIVSVNGEADGREIPAGLARDVLTIPLAIGPNPVSLDLASGGKSFSLDFTVFRVESRGPLRIDSPTDGSFAKAEVVTVTGTVPRGTPLVQVNGVAAMLGPGRGSFAVEVPLEEGENTIRAVAAPFGQSDEVEVTLDTRPPQLVSLLPGDGTVTQDPSVGFAGRTTERARVRITGPGGEATDQTRARRAPGVPQTIFGPPILEHLFELPPLELAEGENPIELRLVDRAGNETIETLSLFRSETALRVANPAEGTAFSSLSADLVLDVFADATLEAVFSAGRRLPGLEGLAVSAGATPPGQFTLSEVPLAPGPTELRIVYRRDATGAQEVLRHRLESTATADATVTGTVTDEATGEPLEGALVSVTVEGTEHVVPTDADGGYAVQVPSGDVVVRVEREGFRKLRVTGSVETGGTLLADAGLLPWDTATSELPPEEGDTTDPDPATTLLGTATERATGEPLAGVLVTVTAGDGSRFDAITDASGGYRIEGIPSGALEGSAVLAGYFPRIFESTTSGTTEFTVDFQFQPIPEEVTLVGTVTSALTGEPAAGVEVAILGSSRSARTDAAGRYVLEDVPTGEQSLRLRKGGFSDRFFVFDDLQGSPGNPPVERDFDYPTRRSLSETLAVPPEATGVVVGELTGAPLAGAEVAVGSTVVTTDAEGRFTVGGLPVLERPEFTAEAPEHEPDTLSALVVPNGEDELRFALAPQTRGFVTGTVRDAETGEPVPLAEVRLEGSPALATASDAEGAYTLVNIPSGSHGVVAIHPEFLPTPAEPVVVADGEEAVADLFVTPRPRTGALEGRVTDATTGEPVEGALLTAPGGASATTDANGAYRLEALPAGLVRLELEAEGFPTTTRQTAVVADPAPDTPRVTEADFALRADGSRPQGVTQVVRADDGGLVETPDRRLAAVIPPGALTGDARITLRAPDPPPAATGERLSLDAELPVDGIEAVGRGTELLIESVVEGEVAPRLEGPLALVLRFSEAEREAAGVSEDAFFPYFFDGSAWTALQILPHFHAVDRINNVALVALDPRETETGAEVATRLTTREPIRLAQLGGGSLGGQLVRRLLFQLASRALEEIRRPEIGFDAGFFDLSGDDPSIHPNALPLFVVHGWDPFSVLQDQPLLGNPLQTREPRYTPIVEDLIGGTDGVYRPIFLTYNSRLSPLASAGLLAALLRGPLLTGGIEGLPADPEDPESGRFPFVNSFGFSMGGLVERVLACHVTPVKDMVSLGSPHHGALQRAVTIVELLGVAALPGAELRGLLRAWSPGTAALLDYDDATGDGNPVLYAMNERLDCTRPERGLGLVGGTDSDLVSDFLSVGESPNDRVVPLRSAFARMESEAGTGHTVTAVAALGADRLHTDPELFNHFDVGKDGGDNPQPIGAFADDSILPRFSDWVVSTSEGPKFLPPEAPGEGERVEAEVTVDFNVPHGDISGVALVLYRKDGNGEWHIEAGANPETREVANVEKISGNSIVRTTPLLLQAGTTLPVPDPTDRLTQTQTVSTVVFLVADGHTVVPPEPEGNFRPATP